MPSVGQIEKLLPINAPFASAVDALGFCLLDSFALALRKRCYGPTFKYELKGASLIS